MSPGYPISASYIADNVSDVDEAAATMARINERLLHLEASAAAAAMTIMDLETHVKLQDELIESLQGSRTRARQRVKTLFERVDELEELTKRVDAIDAKMLPIPDELERLDTRFSTFESTMIISGADLTNQANKLEQDLLEAAASSTKRHEGHAAELARAQQNMETITAAIRQDLAQAAASSTARHDGHVAEVARVHHNIETSAAAIRQEIAQAAASSSMRHQRHVDEIARVESHIDSEVATLRTSIAEATPTKRFEHFVQETVSIINRLKESSTVHSNRLADAHNDVSFLQYLADRMLKFTRAPIVGPPAQMQDWVALHDIWGTSRTPFMWGIADTSLDSSIVSTHPPAVWPRAGYPPGVAAVSLPKAQYPMNFGHQRLVSTPSVSRPPAASGSALALVSTSAASTPAVVAVTSPGSESTTTVIDANPAPLSATASPMPAATSMLTPAHPTPAGASSMDTNSREAAAIIPAVTMMPPTPTCSQEAETYSTTTLVAAGGLPDTQALAVGAPPPTEEQSAGIATAASMSRAPTPPSQLDDDAPQSVTPAATTLAIPVAARRSPRLSPGTSTTPPSGHPATRLRSRSPQPGKRAGDDIAPPNSSKKARQ